MSYTPHLKRGGELYHYRTRGSRNGYSKDPNYRPVGQRATGKLVNGRYVYSIEPKKQSFGSRITSKLNSARNSAGNWLSDRGRDVSKTASKVASGAKKIYGAAKEGVTGQKAQRSYNVHKWNAENQGTYYPRKDTVSLDQNRGKKRTEYELAKKAKADYDRSLVGRAKNAGKAISKFGSTAGNLATNLGKSAKKAVADSREFITGENAKKALNKTKGLSGLVMGKSGKKAAKEAYNKTLPGMIDSAKKTAQDMVKNPGKYADSARKSAGDWLNDRKEDLSKTASSIAKSADSARKNAGNWLKDRGEDLSKTASNAKKAAGDLADKAGKSASEGMKRAGEFISGLTKKKEKSKSNIKPIETKPIETKAKKQKVDAKAFTKFVVESNKNANKSSVSTNDKPNGVSDEYWRDYKFNGGTRESYDKEMKARSSSKSSSKSKTNMSDKPTNVSDEYWEAYTSNGGTRESYDKEMKARSSSKSKTKSNANLNDKPDGVSDEYWRDYIFNGGTRESWDEEQKRRKRNSKNSSKKSSSGSEYRRELEYNSRKNNW